MSGCHQPVEIKPGDSIYSDADYDITKHMAMKTNRGKLDEVMGISVMYATVPMEN